MSGCRRSSTLEMKRSIKKNQEMKVAEQADSFSPSSGEREAQRTGFLGMIKKLLSGMNITVYVRERQGED